MRVIGTYPGKFSRKSERRSHADFSRRMFAAYQCGHASEMELRALPHRQDQGQTMPAHIDILVVQPLVALIFGILILILPKLLNYLIAIYLIFVGIVGLWPNLFHG